jgi:hypothetical protein
MKAWPFVSSAVLGIILLSGSPAISQGNSQGHGHGKGHDKHHNDEDRDDHDAYRYDSHREAIRGWYSESEGRLPPGLAKKDRLPPGLEKQLVATERFLQVCKSVCILLPLSWSAACLHLRQIAHTY